MSEMVERVARAIMARRHYMWADKSGTIFVEPLELAHAAIEAMRQAPVVTTELFPDPIPGDFATFAQVLWNRMIDAALEPDPT